MGECGARPVGGGVAGGAILRESGRLMGGIGGPVIVGLMAVPASRAGQAEVIVDVALHALQGSVRAGEGEAGGSVIKRGARPIGGGVAGGTILRETRGFVRWVGGVVVVGLVAGPAGAGGQAVVAIHVALGARQAGVRSGQGKAGGGVIEGGAGPVEGGTAMTQSAILREPGRGVGRVVGAVIVGLVAVPAGGAGKAEIVIYGRR